MFDHESREEALADFIDQTIESYKKGMSKEEIKEVQAGEQA